MDIDVVVRVIVLALLVAGSLAQGPVIIEPVIVSGSSSAELNFDPAASQPGYAFAYGVEDPKAGNAQSHKEERHGDNVRGEYKVLEADGSVRTVIYTVDPKNGFQANVHQSNPSPSAAFKAEAKQGSNQAGIPSGGIRPADIQSEISADIGVEVPSDVHVDVPVDVSGPSEHAADYFAGSRGSYPSDFDP